MKNIEEWWNAVAGFGVLGLLVLIVVGVANCSTNAMDREAACMSAGGELLGTASWAAQCVDRQMVPVTGVENWRGG